MPDLNPVFHDPSVAPSHHPVGQALGDPVRPEGASGLLTTPVILSCLFKNLGCLLKKLTFHHLVWQEREQFNRLTIINLTCLPIRFQVWPLTQFFLVPLCENSLICLEGKSMSPHRGNTFFFLSSQQLPCLRLGPLKGFLS